MLKTILLLTPIYVTLFWGILLNCSTRDSTIAKRFLGKFMLFAFCVYAAHLIFYHPFPSIYMYIDPFYQFASLLVYPLYYIYLRLLTVDYFFDLKKHWFYFVIPIGLIVLYSIGFVFAKPEELQAWIFNRSIKFNSLDMKYLRIIYFLIRLGFITQVVYLMIASSRLLKQYAFKAVQFYSDIQDSKNRNVFYLNSSMVLTGVFSVILASLGRDFFQNELITIALASVIFSSLLFIIGYLGYKQKSVNLIKSTNNKLSTLKSSIVELNHSSQKALLNKISNLFIVQKIYLNENLNIIDLANLTGTNRTYISQLINHHFEQNFCTFVNSYRVEEVKKYILYDPKTTNQILAEKCGFSSPDSLKRVVKQLTGISITELKNELLKKSNIHE